MARSLRIDVAYCVELKRVVDIQEACAEFFNQHEHEKFHFLCSDEDCRHSLAGGVRVTAVNHYRLPEEQQKSPHYREFDPHIQNCYWEELKRALDEDDDEQAPPDEKEKARRRAARKVSLLITKFIIPTDENDEEVGSRTATEIERIRKDPDPRRRRKALREYAQGLGATATSLESLVSCFEELKEINELEQTFMVEGVGDLTFRQAFRHVKLGPTSRFGVYYGGARLQVQRYGEIGFALKFLDRIEEKPLTIYVSPDAIRRYRPSARMVRMMDGLEKRPAPKPYVRVYWIGGLEKSDKGWRATVKTLAHVVLRVVQPKARSQDEEAEESAHDGN